MRTRIVGSVYLAFSAVALAQTAVQATQEQALRFANAQTAQSVGEIATAIKVIADANVKVSDDNSTLTVRGTPEQMALANWLFVELDQPPGTLGSAVASEYKVAGAADNTVHVYHVTNAQTTQEFQEIATAIRTVAEIRRVYTYNATHAMITRATSDQIALTDWLLPLMDRPLGARVQHTASPQQTIPDPHDEGVTRVFYVANAVTVRDFQELATTIRTIASFLRVFTYNEARAMVVRGVTSQLEMALWLFNELDQAGTAASGSQPMYQVPGQDDVVRVFYFTNGINERDLEYNVAQIRASSKVQRTISYGPRIGLILRGSAAQMASAEHLAQELMATAASGPLPK